jgi:hypothetical protein
LIGHFVRPVALRTDEVNERRLPVLADFVAEVG